MKTPKPRKRPKKVKRLPLDQWREKYLRFLQKFQ